MRSVEYARARGREARREFGASPVNLLARLRVQLRNVHCISLVPVGRAQANGSSAEIDAKSMVLKYDESLGPEQLLTVLAHELGHLVLHARLRDGDMPFDPLLASAYGDAGPSATARYSPRILEEAQATAFALELVAPSDMVWTAWCGAPDATAASLATRFGCSAEVIHTQLAHALHTHAMHAHTLGGNAISAGRVDVPYTAAQLEAAQFVGAPAIVDAGPGTGKTATVIRRIQFLLEERGALPSEILALTFSNEAAQELSARIAIALGADVADAVNVRTFHGFGMEFLHFHGHLLGVGERYTLLDEDRQVEVVYGLLGTIPCDRLIDLHEPLDTAKLVVEHINFCKQRLIAVETIDGAPDEASQLAALWRGYEEAKRRAGQIDFADLIAFPISILEAHPDVRAAYATRYAWVIVDEFQDVTRATSRLLAALCGPSNPPWVVGDARQSIYQFLGAAPENVTGFASDFADAHVFALDVNHRSCEPVVNAANQLAALLENPDGSPDATRARWKPGMSAPPSLGDVPVVIAEAASDAAEAQGVAVRVGEWIAHDGVSPRDIAVLCRRHVDVRRVMLALGRAGIRAQASGVVTADGVAGDLAAMLTLADAPTASVPRVVFALGRGRRSAEELHAIVSELLRGLREQRELRDHVETAFTPERGDDVARELMRVHEMLEQLRDRADGFSAVAAVLFDHGAYLRRILAMPNSAERQMALGEIVSVLSLAASYRAAHRDIPAAAARIGFAERLRARSTRTLPVPLSTRPRADAVHVMTCHASKGLEFPCVAIVGQARIGMEATLDWLPPSLRSDAGGQVAQANALLFVSVTRATRAVVVSLRRRIPATTRRWGRGREQSVVQLDERWRGAFSIPAVEWSGGAVREARSSYVQMGNIWSVPLPMAIRAQALDDSVCPLLSYLEMYVGVRFPELLRALYPLFVSGVRRSLSAVVAWASDTGAAAGDDDARAIFAAEWAADKFADHPHSAIYKAAAERMMLGFARAFSAMAGQGVADLKSDVVLPSTDGLDVQLDLIARYRRSDGSVVAIAFRPESLAGDQRSLNWSELAEAKRMSLALLESASPGVSAYVYSGADGRIYEYLWSRDSRSLPRLAAGLEARRGALARGEFGTEVSRYQCDRCRARVSCPRWMGAAGEGGLQGGQE